MSRISSAPKDDRARQTAVLSWEHLEALSSAQLVELHNSVTEEGKHVKRFSDKTVALRRTWQAVCRHKAWLAEDRRAAQKAQEESNSTRDKRSVAAATSWDNPIVHRMRSSRIKVVANGTEYNSVGRAFSDLQLEPYSAHISFRARLRDQGAATFTSRDGRKVNFKLQAIVPPVAQRDDK